MGASDYIRGLREKVGHDLLLLPGVTAIVVRGDGDAREILLARRSDNAEWTPITGCCHPDEDVDATAVRECREETGVDIAVERVTWIDTLTRSRYPHGDVCQFFDTCVLAHPVGGEAHVADTSPPTSAGSGSTSSRP